MPVIIYGVRDFGRVDAHAGEHAQTSFFHIWFAPLFPTGSTWVTGPRPDGTNAHAIKLHAKSIAAAYLRIWAPIIGVGCLSAGLGKLHVAPIVFGAVLLALSAWSWTWRTLRGASALRRSDFNFVAFGTRCEPSRLVPVHRARLKKELDQRWTERSPKLSPNEVAQHGATDAAEAVLAYGLLRLSSIERGAAGASDGRDADRILAGEHEAPTATEGPYRAGPAAQTDAATQVGLAALVEQRATEARNPGWIKIDQDQERIRARKKSRWQLAGLVFLTLSAVGGTLAFVASLEPTREVSIKELRGINPPRGRIVTVTCDRIDEPLWFETDKRGKTVSQIAMCYLGRYALPIRVAADDNVPYRVVTGKLREVSDRLVWVSKGLRTEPGLEARTLDVYVDASDDSDLGTGLFGLTLLIVTPVLWVLWFRARRRRLAHG
ncbi:MAG: hypothetical protein H0T46_29020 [Deltaproteobacteria bacterium]|nr:hypothetical protein [Deltaproteobacteria bacterium]